MMKMSSDKKRGVVLAVFGTVEPAGLATYESIQKKYESAFSGCLIHLAFTSSLMRERLREKSSIDVPSPLAALASLHDGGVYDAVVQSLQIVPGDEFHRLAGLVRSLRAGGEGLAFRNLGLGLPLLSCLDDCRIVSAGLAPLFAGKNGSLGGDQNKTNKTATVLMGHGTGHPADGLYSLMAAMLRRDHENVFLCTLEGFPGIAELVPELQRWGFERVELMSFLLVAGSHARQDMAGKQPDSWKSILERNGFKVEVNLHGLAESEDIVSLFLEHTRTALKRDGETGK